MRKNAAEPKRMRKKRVPTTWQTQYQSDWGEWVRVAGFVTVKLWALRSMDPHKVNNLPFFDVALRCCKHWYVFLQTQDRDARMILGVCYKCCFNATNLAARCYKHCSLMMCWFFFLCDLRTVDGDLLCLVQICCMPIFLPHWYFCNVVMLLF